jgi:hypothetical protein
VAPTTAIGRAIGRKIAAQKYEVNYVKKLPKEGFVIQG